MEQSRSATASGRAGAGARGGPHGWAGQAAEVGFFSGEGGGGGNGAGDVDATVASRWVVVVVVAMACDGGRRGRAGRLRLCRAWRAKGERKGEGGLAIVAGNHEPARGGGVCLCS